MEKYASHGDELLSDHFLVGDGTVETESPTIGQPLWPHISEYVSTIGSALLLAALVMGFPVLIIILLGNLDQLVLFATIGLCALLGCY